MAKCLKILPLFLAISPAFAQSPPVALDRSLRPAAPAPTGGEVFRDMIVVQRRAMPKGGRFLLSTYGSMDFSDGPYSMYGLQINPGYAISDFFEVYLNYAPFFVNSARPIVKAVREATHYELSTSKPKHQYGFEVLWALAYGKDSLGARRVLRSDTFIKLGFNKIQYDVGSGFKYHAAFGKTYFFGKYVGFRPAVTGNLIQVIREHKKQTTFVAMVEAGFVFYY